jgi:hypothetical protein
MMRDNESTKTAKHDQDSPKRLNAKQDAEAINTVGSLRIESGGVFPGEKDLLVSKNLNVLGSGNRPNESFQIESHQESNSALLRNKAKDARLS